MVDVVGSELGNTGAASAEALLATGAVETVTEFEGTCEAPLVAAFDCGPVLAVDFGTNVGSNTGKSGFRVVARVRSVTSKPGGKLEKYFCL